MGRNERANIAKNKRQLSEAANKSPNRGNKRSKRVSKSESNKQPTNAGSNLADLPKSPKVSKSPRSRGRGKGTKMVNPGEVSENQEEDLPQSQGSQVENTASPARGRSRPRGGRPKTRSRSVSRVRNAEGNQTHNDDNLNEDSDTNQENLDRHDEMPDDTVATDPDGVSLGGNERDFVDSGEEYSDGELPPSHEDVEMTSNASNASPEVSESESDSDSEVVIARRRIEKKMRKNPSFRRAMNQVMQEQGKRGNKVVRHIMTTTPINSPLSRNGWVKSPSDTTLYTPSLKMKSDTDTVINRISNFVEGIRLDRDRSSGHHSRETRRSMDRRRSRTRTPPQYSCSRSRSRSRSHLRSSRSHRASKQRSPRSHSRIYNRDDVYSRHRLQHARDDNDHHRRDRHSRSRSKRRHRDHGDRDELARKRESNTSDKIVLQAEKFRATLAAPKGKYEQIKEEFITDKGLGPINDDIQMLRNFDTDDEFFHVTCHIDLALSKK